MNDRKRPNSPPSPSQTERSVDLGAELGGETVLEAPVPDSLKAGRPAEKSQSRRSGTPARPAERSADPPRPSREMRAAPAAPKRPTSARPAVPQSQPNETVLINTDAAARKDIAVDDAPTAGRSLAVDDSPTQNKRPLADLVDNPGEEAEVTGTPANTVLGEKARGLRGIQLLVAAFMVLLGLGLGGKLLLSRTRTPSTDELQLLYPFGLGGGNMPNGRRAPGSNQLSFKLVHEEDCGGNRCLTYLASSSDGSFQYKMTVRDDDDGLWRYVSSGMVGGP